MFKEWPLVAFTVLGQTAVGAFLVFHLPFLVRGRTPYAGWRATWLVLLALALFLSAVAALVSFFHLRHPWRARFVLSNWRASWLSREILFELAFMGLVAASGWLAWAGAPSRTVQLAALAAAGLAGVLFLVSMIKLYTLPTLPAWRGGRASVSFTLTALVLGALVAEAVIRAVAGPGAFSVDLAAVAAVLIAAGIVWAVIEGRRWAPGGRRPRPSLRPDAGPSRSLRAVHRAGLVSGLAFVVADLARGGDRLMDDPGAGPLLLLALGSVVAGEIAGRFAFYGLVRRPGD
ncbi:MAG: dimethyl sulfoxide reductase anchor subunit [Candidatus Aminicenantes bacterium]|nr:dimethyl sulfoxide reductase anchor subunit [Candidatus Aminicenantes bacterium]